MNNTSLTIHHCILSHAVIEECETPSPFEKRSKSESNKELHSLNFESLRALSQTVMEQS